MSAETLRRAAALMRERAEAATLGPWEAQPGAFGDPGNGPDHMRVVPPGWTNASDAVCRTEYERQGGADAEHIAAWHPTVALAVADWLDHAAMSADLRRSPYVDDHLSHALKVARAFLGEDNDV